MGANDAPLQFTCPECKAPAGSPCKKFASREDYHGSRVKLALKAEDDARKLAAYQAAARSTPEPETDEDEPTDERADELAERAEALTWYVIVRLPHRVPVEVCDEYHLKDRLGELAVAAVEDHEDGDAAPTAYYATAVEVVFQQETLRTQWAHWLHEDIGDLGGKESAEAIAHGEQEIRDMLEDAAEATAATPLGKRVEAALAKFEGRDPIDDVIAKVISMIDGSRSARAAGDVGSEEASLKAARRHLVKLLGLEDK